MFYLGEGISEVLIMDRRVKMWVGNTVSSWLTYAGVTCTVRDACTNLLHTEGMASLRGARMPVSWWWGRGWKVMEMR